MIANTYIDYLKKISYLEGIIRMSVNYKDPTPLEIAIRDSEIADLITRQYKFDNLKEFTHAFLEGSEEFHKVLDQKFAGEDILFHTRKHRMVHQLPNTHLIYSIEGGCTVIVGETEITLNEGDACMVAAGINHAYYNSGEDSLTLHVIMTPAFISTALMPQLPQEFLKYGFFRNVVFDSHDGPSYIFCPKSKSDETTFFLTSAFYYDLFRPYNFKEIVHNFISLYFNYTLLSMNSSSVTINTAATSEQLLQQIQDYVVANCRTISLQQLAEQFHFNTSYMSQYLKKKLNKNFTTILQEARIVSAEKMLINTNLSIVEIADRVGYQNVNYFYKIFNKVNNCSPTEYREQFFLANQRVIGHESRW